MAILGGLDPSLGTGPSPFSPRSEEPLRTAGALSPQAKNYNSQQATGCSMVARNYTPQHAARPNMADGKSLTSRLHIPACSAAQHGGPQPSFPTYYISRHAAVRPEHAQWALSGRAAACLGLRRAPGGRRRPPGASPGSRGPRAAGKVLFPPSVGNGSA